MRLTVIHMVRITKGAPPEPVGVWAISGEHAEPFYPPQFEKYLHRGAKALMQRPSQTALEDWVDYKAHTSSSWRILKTEFDFQGDASTILPADTTMEETYRHVHDEYLSKVAGLSTSTDESSRSHPTSITDWETDNQDSATASGSPRFARAQSWWIASELVQRHPDLLIHEMHPAGGTYDVLCVTSPEQLSPEHGGQSVAPRVMLNRAGTVQVHFRGDTHMVGDWHRVMAAPTPHSIVKELEALTGWGSPVTAPPTTPRTIAYRFLATALSMLINDRWAWDARNEFVDSAGYHSGDPNGYTSTFPAAIQDLRSTPHLGIWGEPNSHFWALLCDNEPVVGISIEGRLYYTSGKTVDLMTAYDQHNRRVIPMTAALLKKWL